MNLDKIKEYLEVGIRSGEFDDAMLKSIVTDKMIQLSKNKESLDNMELE